MNHDQLAKKMYDVLTNPYRYSPEERADYKEAFRKAFPGMCRKGERPVIGEK